MLVGWGIVSVGRDDGMETIGVDVGVSVGNGAARVGGTSIPAKSMEVALKPMKRPRPRYLMSVRMVDGVFVTFQRLNTEATEFTEKTF